MFLVISLVLLGVAIFTRNVESAMMTTSGLFAVAGAITYLANQFKKKNDQ